MTIAKWYPSTDPATPSWLNQFVRRVLDMIYDMDARAADNVAWKGTWVAGSSYARNTMVIYKGFTYLSVKDGNRNNDPTAADTAWWILL